MQINNITKQNISHFPLSQIAQTSNASADGKSSLTSSKTEKTCWESFTSCLKKGWGWIASLFSKLFGCCKSESKLPDVPKRYNPLQLYRENPEEAREALNKDKKTFLRNFMMAFLNEPQEFANVFLEMKNNPNESEMYSFLTQQAEHLSKCGSLDTENLAIFDLYPLYDEVERVEEREKISSFVVTLNDELSRKKEQVKQAQKIFAGATAVNAALVSKNNPNIFLRSFVKAFFAEPDAIIDIYIYLLKKKANQGLSDEEANLFTFYSLVPRQIANQGKILADTVIESLEIKDDKKEETEALVQELNRSLFRHPLIAGQRSYNAKLEAARKTV